MWSLFFLSGSNILLWTTFYKKVRLSTIKTIDTCRCYKHGSDQMDWTRQQRSGWYWIEGPTNMPNWVILCKDAVHYKNSPWKWIHLFHCQKLWWFEEFSNLIHVHISVTFHHIYCSTMLGRVNSVKSLPLQCSNSGMDIFSVCGPPCSVCRGWFSHLCQRSESWGYSRLHAWSTEQNLSGYLQNNYFFYVCSDEWVLLDNNPRSGPQLNLFCRIFTIKDNCRKVFFLQAHNQGLHQLFFTVSLCHHFSVSNAWEESRALEWHHISSKIPSRAQDGAEGVTGRIGRENCFFPTKGRWWPSRLISDFFCKKLTGKLSLWQVLHHPRAWYPPMDDWGNNQPPLRKTPLLR